MNAAAGPNGHSITIDLDGESLTVPGADTTPNGILAAADLDIATHYLVHLEGKNQVSYQGRGDEPIKVHHGEKFLSLSTGPTPTS